MLWLACEENIVHLCKGNPQIVLHSGQTVELQLICHGISLYLKYLFPLTYIGKETQYFISAKTTNQYGSLNVLNVIKCNRSLFIWLGRERTYFLFLENQAMTGLLSMTVHSPLILLSNGHVILSSGLLASINNLSNVQIDLTISSFQFNRVMSSL